VLLVAQSASGAGSKLSVSVVGLSVDKRFLAYLLPVDVKQVVTSIKKILPSVDPKNIVSVRKSFP